jgi:arylsulfatase A-like enzyme
MRLPGVIPGGSVVKAPVSHLDLFATILNYCRVPAPPSEGRSLRPLIEVKEADTGRYVVSEWHGTAVPGFMVFDGRWKLLVGRTAGARSLDALYDLESDPLEVNNLLGSNPQWENHQGEAERLKRMLVEWLTRIKSPHLESVKVRPITRQADRPKKKDRSAQGPSPKEQ